MAQALNHAHEIRAHAFAQAFKQALQTIQNLTQSMITVGRAVGQSGLVVKQGAASCRS
jgi:hypothetical protein